MTWKEYGEELETRLLDLHKRVQSGRYRAMPSKRIWIPKADGRKRPIGIATLEDKVVQQAVVQVLNQIYEETFLGFSYGFRPGRHQHNALDAVKLFCPAKTSGKRLSFVSDFVNLVLSLCDLPKILSLEIGMEHLVYWRVFLTLQS